jgi:ferredoxin
MSSHLTVNPIVCDGHGICSELLPEHITLDDWGFPIIDPAAIPVHRLADARRAVKLCPVLALRLQQASSQPDGVAK